MLPKSWKASTRWTSCACAVVAAVHALTFLPCGPLDDDYIVYRYARNLAEGRGLVFNVGERVEGFTAPLWTLMCALGIKLGVDPVVLSRVLGVAGAAIAAFAVAETWRAWWPESRWPAAALLVALCPAVAYHAGAGLGTTALAALIALWLWQLVRAERSGRPATRAAAILGVACLVRAEAVLFALPFLIVERRRVRAFGVELPLAFAPLALALAPLAAWEVFRVLYFGHWLPMPYYVKRLPLLDDVAYGLAYLRDATLGAGVGACACIVAIALWKRSALLDAAWKVAAIGFVLHTAYVVLVGGDYMSLYRFFVPALPVAILLATQAVFTWMRHRPQWCAAAAIGALALMQWTQTQRAELSALYEELDARWVAIGKTLRRTAVAGTSVAAEAVGAIGYHSELPIVDMLGMTNDVVRKAPPDLTVPTKGHHRYDVDWVLSRSPDIILIGRGLLLADRNTLPTFPSDRGFYTREAFTDGYTSWAMPIDGSYPLVFYLRRGAEPPHGARMVPRTGSAPR